VQGLLVDEDVEGISVVGNVVLGLGHHILRLYAADFGCTHESSKQGVFAEGVVATSESDVTIDVDEGLKRNIDAQRTRFAADDNTVCFGVLEAECGSYTHRCCFGLSRYASQQTGRAIGETERGDVEARHTGEKSSLALIGRWVF